MTGRFSQGCYSGFVPEFRHDEERIVELAGTGDSKRVELHSCAPKRNNINISTQVFSLSKMTAKERRELERRLKSELEQIKALRNRIGSSPRQEIASVPSSNGNFIKEYPTRKTGTKQKPPVDGKKPGWPRQDPNTMLFKQCKQVLKNLMSRKYAWIFNTPVDPKNLNIPDYFEIIKHPMDLGTVKANLDSDSYPSPWGFVADVRLTFTNAKTYNSPNNDVHKMADTMSKIFEAKWKPIEKKLIEAEAMVRLGTEPAKTLTQSLEQWRKCEGPVKTTMTVETSEAMSRRGTEPAKTLTQSVEQPRKSEDPVKTTITVEERDPVKTTITVEERERLISCLESLGGEFPDNISDFIVGHLGNGNQPDQGEIEIDIYSFSDDRWFELQKLLNDHFMDIRLQQQAETDACEVEVMNVSALNSSRMPHCKGNGPTNEGVGDGGNNPLFSSNSSALTEKESSSRSRHIWIENEHTDDDVDIGGNETPMPTYPPVVIQKDSPFRSNSRSDSDSSSSVSNSSSSSGSDSDDSQTKAAKGSIRPEAVIDHNKINATNPVAINRTVSGLDHSKHDVCTKSAYVDTDGPQDGAKSQSEKQISREKFNRGALMRNCFTDRILNDNEKTPDQCEEHEWKQRKAEKAQIQAEVKASEEASRQAEAKAAAEPKLKLQHEREAAHQALLKMKKTVEINESSATFEDMVKLTGVGGFKFGESNLLEQLGLFMKSDGEEKEESE